MPAILLGSKTSRRHLGRTNASPKTMLAPKTLSGTPVEMLVFGRAAHEDAGTGIPAILLGSKTSRHH
jgi:hypothetical protein